MEFALILPILVILLLGVVEFGRAYNAQLTLTHAAREGVRVMAITNNPTEAKNAALNAATSLNPSLQLTNIAFNLASCAPTSQVTVTISYNLETISGFAGPFKLTGKGAMLCGG